MNKTYQEIRAHSELVDYLEQFSGRKSLWCELYRDGVDEYRAYFEPYNNDSEPQLIQRILIDNT